MSHFSLSDAERKRIKERNRATKNHGNKPEEKPLITLYANWLTNPKPDDVVSHIAIISELKVDPDKLEIKLRKRKIENTIVIFMRRPEGNKHLLVLLKTPRKFGVVADCILKAIGELTA